MSLAAQNAMAALRGTGMPAGGDDDDDNLSVKDINVPTKVILEGVLQKQSPRWKIYQNRYVKLTNVGLYYYADKNAPEKGLIPLSIMSKVESDPKRRRFDIKLHAGDRVFRFEAASDAEFNRWVNEIQKLITEYQDNDGHYEDDPSQMTLSNRIWKDTKKALNDHARRIGQRKVAVQNFYNSGANADDLVISRPLFDSLFGDLKVVFEDISGLDPRFGRLHVLGDAHYSMSRRSYLVHVLERPATPTPVYNAVRQAMDAYRNINHPLLAQQLHIGETADATFAIYHPPVRATRDSLDAHLKYMDSFPEEAIRYVAAQLISILEAIHAAGFTFTNLCTETVFVDLSGFIRVFDWLLCLDPAAAPTIAVEYTPPEITHPGGQTQKSDFWRLGVLLYELLTGLPPFRATPSGVDEHTGEPMITARDVIAEIDRYATHKVLPFPEGTSPELCDLISSLLTVNPAARLTSFEKLRGSAFFKSIASWDVTAVRALFRPKWIVDQILLPLRLEPDTPSNLDILPEPVAVTRVCVTIVSAKLPKELMGRVYCNVYCEGHSDKTPVAANDAVWNHGFVFEILSREVPDAADVVIDLHSKKYDGQHLGTVQVPLKAIRNGLVGGGNGALTILTPEGLPIGELIANFMWREDDIPLNGGILNMFTPTDQNVTFAQIFGSKRSADNPLKLLEMVTNATIVRELSERFKAEAGQDDGNPELDFAGATAAATVPVNVSAVSGSPASRSYATLLLPASPLTTPMNANTMKLQRNAHGATVRNLTGSSPSQIGQTMRLAASGNSARALPSYVNPADEAALAAASAAAEAAAAAAVNTSPRTGSFSPASLPDASTTAHNRMPSTFVLNGTDPQPGSSTPTSGAQPTPGSTNARGHRSSTFIPPSLPTLPQTPIANPVQLRTAPPVPGTAPPTAHTTAPPTAHTTAPPTAHTTAPPTAPPQPTPTAPPTMAVPPVPVANPRSSIVVPPPTAALPTPTATARPAPATPTTPATAVPAQRPATTTATTTSSTTAAAGAGAAGTSSGTATTTTTSKPKKVLTPEEIEEANNNPDNWFTTTDASSGKTYYYNKITRKTNWNMPECKLKTL